MRPRHRSWSRNWRQSPLRTGVVAAATVAGREDEPGPETEPAAESDAEAGPEAEIVSAECRWPKLRSEPGCRSCS